jgi:hypothetical protein
MESLVARCARIEIEQVIFILHDTENVGMPANQDIGIAGG